MYENFIKPINSGERLKFILSRMNNYHSFVQLTELFIEMEKLFWKQQDNEKGVEALSLRRLFHYYCLTDAWIW